ncbi:MAG: hypothetical protein ACKOX6_11295 [Bdellovibrio sp.]
MIAGLSRIEKLVYLVAACGLAATGYFLFFNQPTVKRVEHIQDSSIGFVRPLGSDVRVRGNADAGWNSIRSDANVFEFDKVYTGQKSSAIVNLKSKQSLTIHPNSLIVIGENSNEVRVNLNNGGGFLGELRKGVRLLVKKDKAETQIESNGATIQLESRNTGEIKLVVLKGEAAVKSETSPEPVKVVANEEVKITEEKIEVKPLTIELATPDPGDVVWNRGEKVHFSWSTQGEESPGSFLVDISKDPRFLPGDTQSVETSKHFVDLDVDSGSVYFWRVRNKKNQRNSEGSSPTSSFSFFDLKAPIVADSSHLEIKTDWRGIAALPVFFEWRDPSLSDSYEFQVSQSENFNKVIFHEETSLNKVAVSNLPEGTLFWRVISKKERRENLYSNIGRFTVVAEKKPEPEVVVPPKRILAEESPGTPPEVVPAAVSETTVAAVPVEKAESPVIEPIKPPLPLSPVKVHDVAGVFELQDSDSKAQGNPPALPSLTWAADTAVDNYAVEVSSDKNFQKIIVNEPVMDSEWTWKNPSVGQFYARVRSERQWGDTAKETVVSEPVSFRTILTAPQIAKLAVDEVNKNVINVSWNQHKLASQAEVRISKNESFADSKSYKSAGKEFTMEVDEPTTYFVRARFLNSAGWPVSKFSAVKKVVVPDWRPVEAPIDVPAPVEVPVQAPLALTPLEQSKPVAEPEDTEEKYLLNSKGSVYLGSGLDYLLFDQSGASGSESGHFGKVAMPTQLLGAQVQIGKRSRLIFEYHFWPSEIEAGEVTKLNDNKYNWTSMLAEYQYKFHQTHYSAYSILVGVQQHQIPYLSVNSLDKIDILTNQLMNASLGVQAKFLSESRKYEYEIFMRYQHLMSSSSLNGHAFTATPVLMFDGSIGVSRYFDNGFKAGLYWFGQQQYFNYEFTREGVESTGTQNLFNSNIQFRIGWEFFGLMTASSIPISVRIRRRLKKRKQNEKP